MKKALIIALALMIFVGFSVYRTFSVSPSPQELLLKTDPVIKKTCTQDAARTEVLGTSTLTDLRRLADYDNNCGSKSTDTITLVTYIPLNEEDAISSSTKLANELEELAKYRISPLVLFSFPINASQVNASDFIYGRLDSYISNYYKYLTEKGIDQEEFGNVVFAPLPNLPYYGGRNLLPGDFVKIYNRNLAIVKKYYPTLTTSILLSSATYESTGFSRIEGEYITLLPYLDGISASSIYSLGFEGFPGDGMFSVSEFLNPPVVSEIISQIGVKNIWFRTGTYAAINPLDPKKSAYLPVDVRQQMLNQIKDIAAMYKFQGYTVGINLVSYDETPKDQSGTDWSYFGSSYTNNPLHSKIITEFITSLTASDVEFSLQLSY